MVRSFLKDESGQGMVEYALIVALIAVALIAVMIALRGSIGNIFNKAGDNLNNAGA